MSGEAQCYWCAHPFRTLASGLIVWSESDEKQQAVMQRAFTSDFCDEHQVEWAAGLVRLDS